MNLSKTLPLAVLLFASEAQARDPGIVPPGGTIHGTTYGEWNEEFTRWKYGGAAEEDPIGDTTGEYGALRQSGPVWFLVDAYWGETVSRTLTVPRGKFLFVPILAVTWVNIPELGDNPWSIKQRGMVRDQLAIYIDIFDSVACEIDGVSVSDLGSYRLGTADGDAYMVYLPEDSGWGLDPGFYGPTMDDGVYILIRPLSVGEHTIHFHTEASEYGFVTDVTYDLTVE
jgi:hypothetical protein